MQNRKQSKSMEEKYRRIAERINRDNHFFTIKPYAR